MIVKDALECSCLSNRCQSELLDRLHLCIKTHVHVHVVAHSLILKACCAFSMQNFQAVTSATPGNVLRYCCDPGAQPLWGRASPTPDSIPPCRCGAPRRFEFQILPQLLSYLDLDDASSKAPDWYAQHL